MRNSTPVTHLFDLFATGSYAANGLSVAAACSAVAILLLGAGVLGRAPKSGGGLQFLVVTATCSAWILSFSLMYAATSAHVAWIWARVGGFALALIAPAMYHLSVVYVGRAPQLRKRAFVLWALCIIVGVAFNGRAFIGGVRHFAWGYYPRVHFGAGLAVLIYMGVAAGAIALLRDAYATSEGKPRERAAALTLAFAVAVLAAVDLFPAAGVDVVPIAHIVILAFVIVASTAVWRFRMVDLTPAFAASQILETMKGAVLVTDSGGRIRVVNATASEMLGYDTSALIGMHVRSIFTHEHETSSGQRIKSTGVVEQTTAWRTADGSLIDVLASSSHVRDEQGNPVAAVYVATDYTQMKRAEQAIRGSENRYRMLFECNPLPMWIYDFETLRFTDVNDATVARYGWTRNEFLAMRITDIRPTEEVDGMLASLENLKAREGPKPFHHRTKQGATIETEITSFEFFDHGRKRLVISQDVTERRANDENLRRSEERYRLLFERNLAGVYRTTFDGQILDCNEALARMFGYASRAGLLSQSALSAYADAGERARVMALLREQGTLSNIEVRMRRRDGGTIWVLENVTLLDGGILEGTIVDITDRKSAQERVEYQAYHDVLTGLPNRQLFRDRTSVALAHAHRNALSAAVMFLDLDQFKVVNDTLGHTIGDALLQVVAGRLVSCMRAEDTVSRMGGDEFTILLGDISERKAASVVAQKIIDAMRQPFNVEGHELFVTSSIGIAVYPDDGLDAETLLRNADRAMYRAKDSGRNNYQYVIPAGLEGGEGRLALERGLHQALERDEFVVHYQPIVEVTTGRIAGAEALLRWNHPANGLLDPRQFIATAEESNVMVTVGTWVLRTACKQLKAWHAAGHTSLRMAVNLSARELQHRDVVSRIGEIVAETGVPASALEIEVTESAAMQNVELAAAVLTAIKEMGVHISMDDFGKGYSSLRYLKLLPIDTVKIDQDFVRDLVSDSGDAAIVSAVISIARALNLNVVAEGVETAEQLAFLQRERCELVQGFLHSRPVPADTFERTLLQATRVPPADGQRLPVARTDVDG